MALAADDRPGSISRGIGALLAPFPGRLEFAVRLALICALTTLVVEIYQTPEPALTAYVVFFVTKPDRAASVVTSIVMLVLISLIVGLVLALTVQVIEQPLWRVTAMTLVSFCLIFAASASKLKPVAGTVALVTAYALDLLGSVPGGELATRGVLYVWLFVGIPAGVSILVNLVLGPAPKRLAERALAHRLRLAAAVLEQHQPDWNSPADKVARSNNGIERADFSSQPESALVSCPRSSSPLAADFWDQQATKNKELVARDMGTRTAFKECLHEGPGEIPAWLKLAGAERTSPPRDIAALHQAAQSTNVILAVVDFLTDGTQPPLPESIRKHIAGTLRGMSDILDKGGYPVEITLDSREDEAGLAPIAAAGLAELRTALSTFAEPPKPDGSPQAAKPEGGGFFLPDAFTNPAHVQYALKTTGAAMFCYVVYLLLDWPGIHTCLITCYIVSLGTAAETVEKQALRFLGCGIGAVAGIAAIVFLMPNVTSIGGLMGVVFLAALVAGWIAAGGPRISYSGFQLAFAFLLCVVQGAAPAFDMTIARDRTIGILFGDLVVAVVFTQIWPVTIAGRIDPALRALLRQVAALVSTANMAGRWGLAAELRTNLASFEQDLALTRYEPSAIRPLPSWLDERWEIARTLSALQGPLLIGTDQDPAGFAGTARRLARLAESVGTAPTAESAPGGPEHSSSAISADVETPLARLEQLIEHLSEHAANGTTDYAPA